MNPGLAFFFHLWAPPLSPKIVEPSLVFSQLVGKRRRHGGGIQSSNCVGSHVHRSRLSRGKPNSSLTWIQDENQQMHHLVRRHPETTVHYIRGSACFRAKLAISVTNALSLSSSLLFSLSPSPFMSLSPSLSFPLFWYLSPSSLFFSFSLSLFPSPSLPLSVSQTHIPTAVHTQTNVMKLVYFLFHFTNDKMHQEKSYISSEVSE